MFRRKSRRRLEEELLEARYEAIRHNREKQSALKQLSDYHAGDLGERVHGEHCVYCVHGLGAVFETAPNLGEHLCALQVPCKAFERRKSMQKEENE